MRAIGFSTNKALVPFCVIGKTAAEIISAIENDDPRAWRSDP
jgi:hypothetical protein